MYRILILFFLLVTVSGCSGASILNALSRSPDEVERDIAYGPLARQRLDVYRPRDAGGNTPVLLFIHGGSWQHGSKEDYPFLGSALARIGIATVVADYRLHPEVIYPSFVEDVAAAIAYTKREIAGSRPLFLMGHSAGAHIAALAAGDPRFLEGVANICDLVAGFIGIAGPYDFKFTEDVYKRIFPEQIRETAKPVNHASGSFPPALLLHGTDDDTVPPLRSVQMQEALRTAGNMVDLKLYEGVNHLMIVGALAPILRSRAPTLEDIRGFVNSLSQGSSAACD
ncbi:alpha/beta hydrolase [Oricola cellulosilytica]|uniref:alpha/beta hydrolase n=1 Tax=Oricola cellulosilytica TaxID=1429082 RepID=UPI00130499AB|nr:alpha/beta hydrolase [Oricola cellulosilytica]